MSDRNAIAVVGSLNIDIVVRVPELPVAGETVLGGDYAQFFGGKGANQAVSAARAGANVKMLGAVGDDSFGPQVKAALQAEGIATDTLLSSPGSTGLALIAVSDRGQNHIVVSAGANGRYRSDCVDLDAIRTAATILVQLEIPFETACLAIDTAAAAGVPVLLNPAPARPLSDALLAKVSYLVVNEVEAAAIGGVTAASDLARDRTMAIEVACQLRDRGAKSVIVTLGGAGIAWAGERGEGYEPAFPVDVIDTTAAGDGFCGALAARLVEGAELDKAIRFANAAGAIAVTRAGAQPSLGRRAEIEALLLKERRSH
ncbi:MAG: ribokinase [Cyanobacteria bacterium J06642_2]